MGWSTQENETSADAFLGRACHAAAEYVAARGGEAAPDGSLLAQGYSHRVVRIQLASGQPAVFKLHVNPDCWRRESAALSALAEAPYAPRVLDAVEDRALVLSWVPGVRLACLSEHPGSAVAVTRAFYALGGALARLASIPLPDIGTARADHAVRTARDLAAIRCVFAAEPTFRGPFWRRSLALLEESAVGEHSLRWTHRDINPANVLILEPGRLGGVVDWEACLPEPPATQLGIALFTCVAYSFRGVGAHRLWKAFVAGYGAETTAGLPPMRQVLAAAHAKAWSGVHRDGQYGLWSSIPDWYRLPDANLLRRWLTRCEELVTE